MMSDILGLSFFLFSVHLFSPMGGTHDAESLLATVFLPVMNEREISTIMIERTFVLALQWTRPIRCEHYYFMVLSIPKINKFKKVALFMFHILVI